MIKPELESFKLKSLTLQGFERPLQLIQLCFSPEPSSLTSFTPSSSFTGLVNFTAFLRVRLEAAFSRLPSPNSLS